METQTSTLKKSAMNYGLLLGGILALMTTLMYVMNVELFTKWWVGILSMLLVIILGVISVAKAKGLLNGFISFKEAFTAYFITVAIGYLISTFVGILIFTVIDPDLATFIQERTIEITAELVLSRPFLARPSLCAIHRCCFFWFKV